MQPGPVDTSLALKEGSEFPVKNKENGLASAASPHGRRDLIHDPLVISSDAGDRIPGSMVGDVDSCDASKQLVPYEPKANGSHKSESIPDPISNDQSGNVSKELVIYDPKKNVTHEKVLSPDPLHWRPLVLEGHAVSNLPSRVSPSVGAFTVQCANCFKWRLIPTKERYEEIREHILDQPFVCDKAREWRPEISCEDPPDIEQDASRLWAIDKPSIARPPPGWERELRIRGEGSSKFADVYYIAPSRKRLRSMVEVQKYLLEHPEYVREGVKISQFSFQIPRPLQDNYVKKRSRVTTSCNDSNLTPSRLLEPDEVSPLSLAASDDSTVLRLRGPGLSDVNSAGTVVSSNSRPVKRRKKTKLSPMHERLHNRIKIKLGYPHLPTNDAI